MECVVSSNHKPETTCLLYPTEPLNYQSQQCMTAPASHPQLLPVLGVADGGGGATFPQPGVSLRHLPFVMASRIAFTTAHIYCLVSAFLPLLSYLFSSLFYIVDPSLFPLPTFFPSSLFLSLANLLSSFCFSVGL